MLFQVGLQRDDRLFAHRPQCLKEVAEGEITLSQGQMLIGDPVIVMQVQLPGPGTQFPEPVTQGRPGEGVEMPGIEAKANIR